MSKLSTRQLDSQALINEWARADTEARCPLMHHEYCADSTRGMARKPQTIRSKQNRSNNRKAQRNHTHNVGFEYRYDRRFMMEESWEITAYQAAYHVEKERKAAKRKKKERKRQRKLRENGYA